MVSLTLLFFSSFLTLTLSQTFREVTSQVGITQPSSSEQFGGPTVADLDNDGNVDFILTFHNRHPMRIFHGTGGGSFKKSSFSFISDIHGVSVGPRSARTRERMMTISVGGGNGANLRAPFVYITRPNRRFVGVSNSFGLGQVASRGRTAVFMDMSLRGAAADRRNGGGPDILFVNLLGGRNGGLKQFAYQNNRGRYLLMRPFGIEEINEERAIVTDIDDDGIMEVIHFSVFRVFKVTAPFQLTDVTRTVAPGLGILFRTIAAVVELDVDNDGRMDLYLARANSNLVTPRGPPAVQMFEDILLLNKGGKYVRAPSSFGLPTETHSMGVSAGDFDNDGWVDLVVTTFDGEDFLLKNVQGKRFETVTLTSVTKPSSTRGHNVVAVDYNNDGRVDFIMSQGWRKEFLGRYRLMKNIMRRTNNKRYLLVRVGNEVTRACSSLNAIVTVEAGGMKMIRRIGARGAGLGGQSYLETVHFGLGNNTVASKVTVKWTSGLVRTRVNVASNRKIAFGVDL